MITVNWKSWIFKRRSLQRHVSCVLVVIIMSCLALYFKPIMTLIHQHQHALSHEKRLQQTHHDAQSQLQQCLDSQAQLKNAPNALQTTIRSLQPHTELTPTDDHVSQSLKQHHLILKSFQPIAHQQHSSLYRACGSFDDIRNLIQGWNAMVFLGWIKELSIEPCSDYPDSLQLSLLLENTFEANH